MTVSSPSTVPAVSPPVASAEDPFRYGWRFVRRVGPDGKEDLEQVPLTLEDVLHPQEDDVIPENSWQEQERGDLARIFRLRLPRAGGNLVLSDCIINWGVPGIRNHSPDVSVFTDIVRPQPEPIGTFDLVASGGRCRLAVEIVSPHTRVNDVERKFDHYYRVGVPLYVIVDWERLDGPRQLRGYQRTATGYDPIPLTAQGQLPLPFLGLNLGLVDDQVVCYDAQTGAVVGDYIQVSQALQQEAAARQAAEAQARREAAARQAAEEQARREAEARQSEAAARQAAEDRLRELEAELRRLRGEGPG
jgi:Uma2 family endonuclease